MYFSKNFFCLSPRQNFFLRYSILVHNAVCHVKFLYLSGSSRLLLWESHPIERNHDGPPKAEVVLESQLGP